MIGAPVVSWRHLVVAVAVLAALGHVCALPAAAGPIHQAADRAADHPDDHHGDAGSCEAAVATVGVTASAVPAPVSAAGVVQPSLVPAGVTAVQPVVARAPDLPPLFLLHLALLI